MYVYVCVCVSLHDVAKTLPFAAGLSPNLSSLLAAVPPRLKLQKFATDYSILFEFVGQEFAILKSSMVQTLFINIIYLHPFSQPGAYFARNEGWQAARRVE